MDAYDFLPPLIFKTVQGRYISVLALALWELLVAVVPSFPLCPCIDQEFAIRLGQRLNWKSSPQDEKLEHLRSKDSQLLDCVSRLYGIRRLRSSPVTSLFYETYPDGGVACVSRLASTWFIRQFDNAIPCTTPSRNGHRPLHIAGIDSHCSLS